LRFELIEHKLVGEVECILVMKHTKEIGKKYLIKWKRCHPKELYWMKFVHLNFLSQMVEKFEWECGHEMGNMKMHKDKSKTLT
jgi:hypothetical protein